MVKKKIKGHEYYYLKESKREGKKVKTKNIAYLGKTKKEAEEKLKQLQQPKEQKKPEPKPLTIEDMAVFCKRRGFVYQDSEIYGGLAGFWDFGPIGVELKNNIKNHWWKTFVNNREDVVGIDGSIITHKKIWEASGHVSNFNDLLIECEKCKNRFRADILIEDQLKINTENLTEEKIKETIKEKVKCPCGGKFKEPQKFNLMFQTNVGPLSGNMAYLRPETAQLIFADFKLVQENARLKLPFGIAQIGKAFRNEISPRDFLFRSREFEQAEIEYFVNPQYKNECPYFKEVENLKINLLSAELQGKDQPHIQATIKDLKKITTEWHAYWLGKFYQWFINLGIKPENLRLREHLKKELAHYAGSCFDIEYKFPFGWKEIHGNADRQQFDLNQHIKVSQKDISIYDEESKQKIVPYVAAEPSQGIERAFLAIMFDAHTYDKERENIVLKLNPKLAPFKITVFPLVNKLEKQARELFEELKEEFPAFYDKSGSIGRRYARQDEIGTPLCITIDFDSLKKKDVTIRDRDTTKQIRVKIKDLTETLRKLINKEIKFEKAGKLIK